MRTKTFTTLFFGLALTATTAIPGIAQDRHSRLWTEISESKIQQEGAVRQVSPNAYRTFRLDAPAMRQSLSRAPEEFSRVEGMMQQIITLPMPDGSMERFSIEHSLVVEPGLSAKYPELANTYRGRGIDDPTASVRLDFLPSGFHSMILSPRGTVLVDPYSAGETENYISFYKRDVPRSSQFACEFDEQAERESIYTAKDRSFRDIIPDAASPEVSSGTTLRTYRLALAASNEYAVAVGGNTIAGTLAAQVLIMNRVDGVYERDVAIRMVIVASNNLIVYAGDQMCGGVPCTTANDPFTNDDGVAMLAENQTNLTSLIGAANYDIGHVFSTGGGGVATLNGPCGNNKGRGVTGLTNPVGDPFAIDYVAHEMGHQWGGPHTFNGLGLNCTSGTRSSGSAYEPGSGITIMAYAGICSSQNLAAHSIDTFHVKSLQDIVNYSQSGNGNTCSVQTPTGNTPPAVSVVGGPSFNIPKQTPFTLTASGSDANGDTVTYDWQEFDLGASTTAIPNTDSDGTARPIFRPYLPTSSPSRTFPSTQYILANANVPPSTTGGFLTGELMPAITRTMTFQVVARDNRANGGGINSATATVNVDGNSGPFNVSAPNGGETWSAGQSRNVTWNVANTSAAPVNAANVKISLSTDGGLTFPTVLAASAPNNGSFTFTVPSVNTGQARIKVEAAGNIFFDVTDANFNITTSAATAGFIAGRVTNSAGMGVGKVYVVLTGPGGTAFAFTNSFGFYAFMSVPFGAGYTLTPQRKGLTFNPVSTNYNHNGDIANINFTVQ